MEVVLDLIDMVLSKEEDLEKIEYMIEQGVISGAYADFPRKERRMFMRSLKKIVAKQNKESQVSDFLIAFKIRGEIIGFTYILHVKDGLNNGRQTVEIKLFSILDKYQGRGHSKIALSMIIDTFGMYNIKAICFDNSILMKRILLKENFEEVYKTDKGTRTFLRVAV